MTWSSLESSSSRKVGILSMSCLRWVMVRVVRLRKSLLIEL